MNFPSLFLHHPYATKVGKQKLSCIVRFQCPKGSHYATTKRRAMLIMIDDSIAKGRYQG
ncbi:hypothetical protein SAMN06298226_3152 [Nitrosovibrio sp. Nv4]|nr:hypothetical protein SAMN06298226_3152 [Nitrosovibrio sp. Nv4]